MKIGLYRKRPLPVRAMQWNGSQVEAEAIHRFLGDIVASRVGIEYERPDRPAHISLKTKSGLANTKPMDWIVEEPDGSGWYPVDRTIFEQIYVEVMDDSPSSDNYLVGSHKL